MEHIIIYTAGFLCGIGCVAAAAVVLRAIRTDNLTVVSQPVNGAEKHAPAPASMEKPGVVHLTDARMLDFERRQLED